jgi:multidrug efflux pump subunit AcrA (membrane-fusion protein)
MQNPLLPTGVDRLRRLPLRITLPFVILLLAVAVFVLLRATRATPPPVEAQEKAWRVSVVEVAPGRYTPDLLLYGSVEAPRMAALRAAVTADVDQVPVREGDRVDGGDVLVRLDGTELELLLRQREADLAEIVALIGSEATRHAADLRSREQESALLDLARTALERAEELNRKNMVSRSAVDEARQAVERQRLAVTSRQMSIDDHEARMAQLEARRLRAGALRDQARLDLARTRIDSPLTGRVAGVHVAPGDRVQPGDPLVDVYAEDELEIRAQIPFRHLPAVRAALEAGAPLEARSTVDERPLSAVLDRLSGETDGARGGWEALLRITGGAAAVVPGRLLSLVLRLPAVEDVIEVPFEALYGLDRVYRMDDGRMVAIAVERVGERRLEDGRVRVLLHSPDIGAGDRIITTQLPNAVTGLKVTVADEPVS